MILGACVPLPRGRGSQLSLLAVRLSHLHRRRKATGRTSTRRTDEDHAEILLVGGGAGGSLLEALDARVERGDDILELLELILDKTHGCGIGVISLGRGEDEA